MSRSTMRRLVPAALLLTFALSACGGDDPVADETSAASATDPPPGSASDAAADDPSATDGEADGTATTGQFPVTVTDDAGEVEIAAMPEAIVSLSPTATEMLFAIGAGDQVVAVDEFSDFPEEAPTTDLSGFEPNVEAILTYEPDLVVTSGLAPEIVDALDDAGVPALQYGGAPTFEAAFDQFRALGAATGTDAESTVADLQQSLDELAADVDVEPGLTYYHELSSDLFTATSTTFIGDVYGLFGMENIADEADADGQAFGYPQLSAEYVVDADPDYVFLACTVFCGESAESFGQRDAFGELTAVTEGNVVELDDDVASRWGPRMVDFARSVADALRAG